MGCIFLRPFGVPMVERMLLYWPHTSPLVAYNGDTSVGHGPVSTLFLEPDCVPSASTPDVGHGPVKTLFLGLILCLVPITPCETMLYWPHSCPSLAYNGGTSVGLGPVTTLFLEHGFFPSASTLDVDHGPAKTLFLGLILCLVPMTHHVKLCYIGRVPTNWWSQSVLGALWTWRPIVKVAMGCHTEPATEHIAHVLQSCISFNFSIFLNDLHDLRPKKIARIYRKKKLHNSTIFFVHELHFSPFLLQCNFCAWKCLCTVVVRFPGGVGGWGASLGNCSPWGGGGLCSLGWGRMGGVAGCTGCSANGGPAGLKCVCNQPTDRTLHTPPHPSPHPSTPLHNPPHPLPTSPPPHVQTMQS